MLKFALSFFIGLILCGNPVAQITEVKTPWNPEANVYGEDGDIIFKGKPVMVNINRPAVLQGNPYLRDYQHLTSHYFYSKRSNGTYNYDAGIDNKVFQKNYLDNEPLLYALDDHRSVRYRDMVLNMEILKIGKVSDPQWMSWTQEYINISRMTRAAGKPVAIYGIYAGAVEFQTWYNIGRYKYRLDPNLNPKYDQQKVHAERVGLPKFLNQEVALLESMEVIRDRFVNEIDAVVVSCYMPYSIPSLDSEQWYSYKSYLQQCISAYKLLYPNKPIHVFIQPSYTHSKPNAFQPMSDDVWNATLKEVYENRDVDRVYIFTLTSKQMPENFFESLVYGPK